MRPEAERPHRWRKITPPTATRAAVDGRARGSLDGYARRVARLFLKRRVEAFQLDTGVGCREVPVGLGIVGVAFFLPGVDLTGEHLGIRNAPVEALAGEDSQLRLGEVQPAAMLGRVMPLEALDPAACLGRLESLVERGGDIAEFLT